MKGRVSRALDRVHLQPTRQAHLVHLLELGRDGVEAGHELEVARLAQVVVPRLAGVALGRHAVEVFLALVELGLPAPELLQDRHVGLGLEDTLCESKCGRCGRRTTVSAAGPERGA